jgi:YD repeat-containing protein
MTDGTTYLSPEAFRTPRPKLGSLSAIFDEEGNELRVLRNSTGDLTEIKSPKGSWLRFSYDSKARMVQALSSVGRWAKYLYDSEDRLVTVTYATGQQTKYSYDSGNRMATVEDSLGGFRLSNKYDSTGRVIELAVDPGGLYKFRYLVDDVDITDPNGNLTRVHVMPDGGNLSYTTEAIR